MNSLKALLDPDLPDNKTIFTVVDDEQEAIFVKVVEEVIGDLSKPNTGIMFTLPISDVKGLSK